MQQFMTILFSDIANSTALYQTHGDVEAHQRITTCLKDLRQIVETNQGKLLRTVGDAVLASFECCDQAFAASVEMQRHHERSPLSLRVGFHHGEVIPDEGDVYGNAVNIAARVASFANAGEIYTTQDSVDQLSFENKELATYLDKVEFKGIDYPLPVSRIHWSLSGSSDEDTHIVTAITSEHRAKVTTTIELLQGAVRMSVSPESPVIRLGRALTNDCVVQHDSTSRNHATIELVRGKYLFTDSSTNGSYIVKSGQNVVFVRRESIVLDRMGMIGLGWTPSNDDSQKVSFKSVRFEPVTRSVVLT